MVSLTEIFLNLFGIQGENYQVRSISQRKIRSGSLSKCQIVQLPNFLMLNCRVPNCLSTLPDLVFWLGAGNQLNKSKDYVRAQKCPNSTEIIFADLKLLQKNHNGPISFEREW